MSLVPITDRAPVGALPMLPDYVEFVGKIARTEFVPDALRNKPESILACLMKGYELGLDPMQSLDSIDVIKGKPAIKPEAMRALIVRAGHTIRMVEHTNEKVTLRVRRREWPEGESEDWTWTIEDAKTAKLMGNETWAKYPRAMLLARVTSEVARAHFGDVIKGLSYTPDEVDSFMPGPSRPVDLDTGEIVETRPAPASPTPTAVEATVIETPEPPAAATSRFEPFPEEDEPAAVAFPTDEQIEVLNQAIAKLDVETKAQLAKKWKQVLPAKGSIKFTSEHVWVALELIEKVSTEMAERPFEPAAS